MACPYCGEVYDKDENCEKVKCPTCNIEFNFCCSSKRTPVTAHGNHYHREGCSFFNEDIQQYVKDGC
jgi:hypothetical protein